MIHGIALTCKQDAVCNSTVLVHVHTWKDPGKDSMVITTMNCIGVTQLSQCINYDLVNPNIHGGGGGMDVVGMKASYATS